MNIVLVWIQWSGKGTMARLIQDKYSYSFFEMWQKLRNFCELDTPDAKAVKDCMTAGNLVPIELTGKILSHYLLNHDGSRIIFDGIPRSLSQKEMFNQIVENYVVVFLDLNKEEAIKRLAWRRIDPTTWESFGVDFVGDINPKTWIKLVIRDDDKPDFVRNRVDVFYQNTLPLLASWAKEGIKVYHIDADKTIEEEFAQIDEIISNEFYKSL